MIQYPAHHEKYPHRNDSIPGTQGINWPLCFFAGVTLGWVKIAVLHNTRVSLGAQDFSPQAKKIDVFFFSP